MVDRLGITRPYVLSRGDAGTAEEPGAAGARVPAGGPGRAAHARARGRRRAGATTTFAWSWIGRAPGTIVRTGHVSDRRPRRPVPRAPTRSPTSRSTRGSACRSSRRSPGACRSVASTPRRSPRWRATPRCSWTRRTWARSPTRSRGCSTDRQRAPRTSGGAGANAPPASPGRPTAARYPRRLPTRDGSRDEGVADLHGAERRRPRRGLPRLARRADARARRGRDRRRRLDATARADAATPGPRA